MKAVRAARQEKLNPLRQDVHFLGDLLGQVLVKQEGPAFFSVEERIRKLAIGVARAYVEGSARLAEAGDSIVAAGEGGKRVGG